MSASLIRFYSACQWSGIKEVEFDAAKLHQYGLPRNGETHAKVRGFPAGFEPACYPDHVCAGCHPPTFVQQVRKALMYVQGTSIHIANNFLRF